MALLEVKSKAYTGSLGKSVSTPSALGAVVDLLLNSKTETVINCPPFHWAVQAMGCLLPYLLWRPGNTGIYLLLLKRLTWFPGSSFTSLGMVLIRKSQETANHFGEQTQYACIWKLFANLTARWKHYIIGDTRLQLH